MWVVRVATAGEVWEGESVSESETGDRCDVVSTDGSRGGRIVGELDGVNFSSNYPLPPQTTF